MVGQHHFQNSERYEMSIRIDRDEVIVNEHISIQHCVLSTGLCPSIRIEDLDDEECVYLYTKQEVEQVMKACESFLKHIDSWDYVIPDEVGDK